MSKTIWKFPLKGDMTVVRMPPNAKVLSAGAQGDTVCIWAEVETDSLQSTDERTFYTVGTGRGMPSGELKLIGRADMFEAQLIFHVFEEMPSDD